MPMLQGTQYRGCFTIALHVKTLSWTALGKTRRHRNRSAVTTANERKQVYPESCTIECILLFIVTTLKSEEKKTPPERRAC